MKYYVTSDIHGFYTEFIDVLTKAGWFEDTSEKKLVILGDLFDHGKEAVQLEKFIVDLIKSNQVRLSLCICLIMLCLGTYFCEGFDTYEPFKLFGRINRNHPDEAEITGVTHFFTDFCCL